jgi:hypothetical protein
MCLVHSLWCCSIRLRYLIYVFFRDKIKDRSLLITESNLYNLFQESEPFSCKLSLYTGIAEEGTEFDVSYGSTELYCGEDSSHVKHDPATLFENSKV